MPRRHAVETLPADQFEFLLKAITNGGTDREISTSFEKEFNRKLSKSALHRWRSVAGDELADRYRFVRFQARQLIEDLKEEDADKHHLLIANIEDRLLTAAGEIISQDPIKLLGIHQEEKRRQLKERELALRERTQAFQEEQAQKSDQLQHDRLKIGADVWHFILSYLLQAEPEAADLLTKHNEAILNGLEAHLENQPA
jgi:hypothetical protein